MSNAKSAGLVLTERSLQDRAVQTIKNGQAGYLWYGIVQRPGPRWKNNGKETAGCQSDTADMDDR